MLPTKTRGTSALAAAFTIYWTPQGWKGVSENNPLYGAAGTGFEGKISPGDRVFITNVLAGKLRLLGAFNVDRVLNTARDGKPAEAPWDAPEYLIAQAGSATNLRFIELTDEAVKAMTFSEGKPSVTVRPTGAVDGQTMRAIRKLAPASADMLDALLAAPESSTVTTRSGRLPVTVLEQATPQHVWWAVQTLLDGGAVHGFGESTDYDLIADGGERLPPKAVFGVALARATGREVGPEHFTAGVGSPCFRLLNTAGYDIVPKGEAPPADAGPDSGAASDAEWTEGAKTLVRHLKGERGRGLAQAKRADFRAKHDGCLFCERCSLDPVTHFKTEHGEACIEVHHATTQVAAMTAGTKTRLEDLQCLCANCHRVVHRLLRLGLTP